MRLFPLVAAGLVLSAGVAAAEAAALSDLAACRLDAELVALSFSYEGGPCDRTGDASVQRARGTTATVKVPVVSTADICTAQATKISYSEAVPVQEGFDALEVKLVSPEGEVRAEGRIDIAPASSDCTPPKPS